MAGNAEIKAAMGAMPAEAAKLNHLEAAFCIAGVIVIVKLTKLKGASAFEAVRGRKVGSCRMMVKGAHRVC